MQFSGCTLTRYILSCTAAAMLAGCGGSQPPIGAPGAMPQASAIATYAERGKSWMAGGARKGDLLYVSNQTKVFVYTYPQAKLVGKLALPYGEEATGLCSDAKGNVWIPVSGDTSQALVIEYAHGGKKPIASLTDPSDPAACSVDATTGNLAVTNLELNIAIWPNAQGSPTLYTTADATYPFVCAYDGEGNLFVGGIYPGEYGFETKFADLTSGSGSFQNFSINGTFGSEPGPMQWDGTYLAVGQNINANNIIYQVAVSGSSGTVVSETTLNLPADSGVLNGAQWWIHDGEVIAPFVSGHPHRDFIGFWSYPAGGNPLKVIKSPGGRRSEVFGVTVSVAK